MLAWLVALPGCDAPASAAWSGYAEADYVQVAAPVGGHLQTLAVRPGQTVQRGDALFALEAGLDTAGLDEAKARWAASQALADNAQKGKRQDERAVIAAQLAQAQAQVRQAQMQWQRTSALKDQGFVASSVLDQARLALDQAQARVAELHAALRVSGLAARGDERDAALAQAEAARQAVRQSQWRVSQKQQPAPLQAQVADVYFQPGEYVAAGQPVVSLLPPGAIKARFYVPEADLPRLALGQPVQMTCDGCGAPVAARIVRMATSPEFTPPVIYSNAQRARLVFMVEARPEAGAATALRPGQPLDVRPLAAP